MKIRASSGQGCGEQCQKPKLRVLNQVLITVSQRQLAPRINHFLTYINFVRCTKCQNNPLTLKEDELASKHYRPDNLMRRAKETRSQAKALDEIWLKNALEDVAQAYEWLALRLASSPTKAIN